MLRSLLTFNFTLLSFLLSRHEKFYSKKALYLWASILSGALLIFCFPTFNFFFLAWIALAPFLISIADKKPSEAFRSGVLSRHPLFSWHAVLDISFNKPLWQYPFNPKPCACLSLEPVSEPLYRALCRAFFMEDCNYPAACASYSACFLGNA